MFEFFPMWYLLFGRKEEPKVEPPPEQNTEVVMFLQRPPSPVNTVIYLPNEVDR